MLRDFQGFFPVTVDSVHECSFPKVVPSLTVWSQHDPQSLTANKFSSLTAFCARGQVTLPWVSSQKQQNGSFGAEEDKSLECLCWVLLHAHSKGLRALLLESTSPLSQCSKCARLLYAVKQLKCRQNKQPVFWHANSTKCHCTVKDQRNRAWTELSLAESSQWLQAVASGQASTNQRDTSAAVPGWESSATESASTAAFQPLLELVGFPTALTTHQILIKVSELKMRNARWNVGQG